MGFFFFFFGGRGGERSKEKYFMGKGSKVKDALG